MFAVPVGRAFHAELLAQACNQRVQAAGQRDPQPTYRLLSQFVHRALKGLQSLPDLDLQGLAHRGLDLLLDHLESATCFIELSAEFLRTAGAHICKNGIDSTLQLLARTGDSVACHLTEAFIET